MIMQQASEETAGVDFGTSYQTSRKIQDGFFKVCNNGSIFWDTTPCKR
jgi:hypothetical protein